jgi:stage V sporulation protein B
VFNGYFSAVRRVYKSATVLIIEQFLQIFFTVKFLSLFALKNVEYACVAIAIGTLISELISLLYNGLLCYLDLRKHSGKSTEVTPGITKRMINISFPLALSTYFRSGLVTIEHLLIPYGLRKNGASYAASMSTYGLVHGMVFPIIMFPSCIIYSFSGLLVPELASFNEKKEYDKINKMISRAIRYSIYFSVGVSGVMMCYAYEISMVFYNSAEAYEYIKLFAPLITVMYLDGTVDGILKGLNEQLYSMKINIADALISVLLVYFLVPHLGVKGYIIAIFVCEIFNCTMSLMRLVKISQPEISFYIYIFKPIIFTIISICIVVFLFDIFGFTRFSSEINLATRILSTMLVYLLLLFSTKNQGAKITACIR